MLGVLLILGILGRWLRSSTLAPLLWWFGRKRRHCLSSLSCRRHTLIYRTRVHELLDVLTRVVWDGLLDMLASRNWMNGVACLWRHGGRALHLVGLLLIVLSRIGRRGTIFRGWAAVNRRFFAENVRQNTQKCGQVCILRVIAPFADVGVVAPSVVVHVISRTQHHGASGSYVCKRSFVWIPMWNPDLHGDLVCISRNHRGNCSMQTQQ